MAGKNINKVVVNGSTIFDLTGVTVTPETLAKGVTAHDKSGEKIVGTAELTSAESAETFQIEACGEEGYTSGIGSSDSNSSLYASKDDYCGYIDNTEENVILKSKSSCIIMLNFGLKHGYTESGKDSNDNNVTYHHYFIYRDNTWYKIAKFPASVLSNELYMQVFNLYNLRTDSSMSKYNVKIAADGTVYIKFDGEYKSDTEYYLGGLAIYGS